jgi:addiction module RelB/DinJ family antitoxin
MFVPVETKTEKRGSKNRYAKHRQNTKTAMVRLRIPQERKEQAEKILFLLGLTSTQVVNVLFAQIVARKEVPFRIALPRDIDLVVPFEDVAKMWDSLDDTDYSYLKDVEEVGV